MDIMYKTKAVSTKGRSGKVVVENSTLNLKWHLLLKWED